MKPDGMFRNFGKNEGCLSSTVVLTVPTMFFLASPTNTSLLPLPHRHASKPLLGCCYQHLPDVPVYFFVLLACFIVGFFQFSSFATKFQGSFSNLCLPRSSLVVFLNFPAKVSTRFLWSCSTLFSTGNVPPISARNSSAILRSCSLSGSNLI